MRASRTTGSKDRPASLAGAARRTSNGVKILTGATRGQLDVRTPGRVAGLGCREARENRTANGLKMAGGGHETFYVRRGAGGRDPVVPCRYSGKRGGRTR